MFNPHSLFEARDQVSRPYETTGKIILCFTSFDGHSQRNLRKPIIHYKHTLLHHLYPYKTNSAPPY
jgi:hypothetical protein